MVNRKIISVLIFYFGGLLLFHCPSLFAQTVRPAYPQNYFRNPLGIPIQLSANFGELRSDHWHMGLDIRTNQKIGLPVYAAAGGYISRIGVRPYSYGQFIVINHPNGLSTLYAHLNDFFPELNNYIIDQQYKKESWAIELDFTPQQFPVNQGSLIGYSGNTGGSMGPHLHFEIFDTKTTRRLNPQLFNMPLADNVVPEILRLGLYDRNKSVYEQSPQLFTPKKKGRDYVIPTIKTGTNKISFAIQGFDKANGGGSPNGIYAAQINVDDVPQVKFVLDSIDYDETSYINAHIDYKKDYNGGVYLQHLSKMPGDNGPVYKKINGDGAIYLKDTNEHHIEIKVWDANGNTSNLSFSVLYDGSLALNTKGNNYVKKIIPNSLHIMGKPGIEISFPKNSIYDTVYKTYSRGDIMQGYEVSFPHTVITPEIPLHTEVSVRIKPDKIVPEEWRQKMIIQKSAKGSTIKKAEWDGDWLVAKFGGFGTFQAIADTTPPSINNPGNYREGSNDTINLNKSSRIVFTPKDNFDVIAKFRVELNGKWLRFTNDKRKNWIYKFDEHCPPGVHELKVIIEDLVGNKTIKSWWIRR